MKIYSFRKNLVLGNSYFGPLCSSNLHNELDKYKIKSVSKFEAQRVNKCLFYTKISHDKLESIYIIQPASIRFVISEILEANPDGSILENAKNTLKILQKFFGVNSAGIYEVKRDLIDREFATIGDMKKPDSSDKLIQETIELKNTLWHPRIPFRGIESQTEENNNTKSPISR